MILTVTLNAALDITYRVPRLHPHATNRVTEVSERPGGKGLNVARVLAALGHRTVATGFAGGGTGTALRALLAETEVTDALVPVGGTTRRTVAVVDAAGGDTTQLNEPGPTVSPAEWDTFLGTYRELLADARAVALCGSLPPGVPVDVYARLTRAAHALASRSSSTPAANRCAAAWPPAPTSPSPTLRNSPPSPAAPSRCAPPATRAAAAPTRWPPHWARPACSR